MKFHNKFIGIDSSAQVLLFSGGDQEIAYDRNVLTQRSDWYYKNKTIEYFYNESGHRSKNIANIDLDNYILFTGCSHTEGVGLELQKSYPYVTSELLQCDYYNLALGATGIDVMMYNLISWFSTIKTQPKAVIIQWPDYSRFVTIQSGLNIQPCGTWSTDPDIITGILSDDKSKASFTRSLLAKRLIETVISCPIHYVTVKSQIIPDNIDSIEFTKLDLARDLAHFGIESNKKLAELLVDAIKKH
jgi:hypothetical protein